MTNEEKQILLKDLCARLLCGVKATTTANGWRGAYIVSGYANDRIYLDCPVYDEGDDEWLVEFVKPYLRPMSSMTEEEANDMFKTIFSNHRLVKTEIERNIIRYASFDDNNDYGHNIILFNKIYSLEQFNWLIAHHFDFRGLIPIGLALPAPEGMYND